jgi:hypothetical protein
MEWIEAKTIIAKKMLPGIDINTRRSSLRLILASNHKCWKYDYNGELGFSVRISKYSNNNLDIPWSMLEKCFQELKSSEYNGEVFRELYPVQAKDHPCHVHTVGMIFHKSGIAATDMDEKNYTIIK